MEEVIRSMVIVRASERAGLTFHHVIRLCVFPFGSCNPGARRARFTRCNHLGVPIGSIVLHVRLLPGLLALSVSWRAAALQGVNFKSFQAGSPSWCVLV